jgi:hypothetical protein
LGKDKKFIQWIDIAYEKQVGDSYLICVIN